jgi:hypothetical protein
VVRSREEGSPSSITYGFEIDPHAILGVSVSASLQEIRDAYHAKARKHHPDHGGDDWAFRIVARSYEVLSTARVAGRAREEAGEPMPAERPATRRQQPSDRGSEWLRPGRRDPFIERPRVVDVEILVIRFELTDPTDVILKSPEERTLSSSLNVSWSAPPRGMRDSVDRDAELVHSLLIEAFAPMPERTEATSSWSRASDGKFEGWLSFPTATRAWEAFRVLHDALNDCGLGVNQWTRELVLPRSGR